MYTIDEVLERIKTKHTWAVPNPLTPSPAPIYNKSLADKLGYGHKGICLAVKQMEHHMTSEGWEIMLGLKENGYDLAGNGCDIGRSDYFEILERYLSLRKYPPGIAVVQDKREWDRARSRNNPNSHFTKLDVLKSATTTFKLTIVKDSQHENNFHKASADEIGCHAWIVYYAPKIVTYLAPYLRPNHLIRTYHTVNKDLIPEFNPSYKRYNKGILSGAMSKHYPLRQRILSNISTLRNRRIKGIANIDLLPHPGYANTKCFTPEYLSTLSKYKVSICTASMYGYALRKIIESVACGCIAITDLPVDDALPIIDSALIRIHPDIFLEDLQDIIDDSIANYDEDKSRFYADRAKVYYDYRAEGYRLSQKIEEIRLNYDAN